MHTSTKLQYTPHQFVQCDEVSGLLWDGCRKQSNWIIILIVKYKVGIRIRVHSTYLQSSKSSSCKLEASSALNSLRLFPLSKSALKGLSKQLPTTMMMSRLSSYSGYLIVTPLNTNVKLCERKNSMQVIDTFLSLPQCSLWQSLQRDGVGVGWCWLVYAKCCSIRI